MEYALLIYGDENEWEARDEAARTSLHEAHARFAQLCGERGHKITGGRELSRTALARTVHRGSGSYTVTEGPFAETAEHLGGLYLVETDDVEGLIDLVGTTLIEHTFEIRPVVTNN